MTLSLDLPSLLVPLSGTTPCGEPLRYSQIYDDIREARREDDPVLSQGVWITDYKKADWEAVDALCQNALRHTSKDLQIAAWLLEARIHLDGTRGLTQGLDLILKLTQTYWEGLHPQGEVRLKLYEWIDTRISETLLFIPISQSLDKTRPAPSLLDWQEANQPGAEETTLTSLTKICAQTPPAYYQEIDINCGRALDLLKDLEKTLHAKGPEAPPTFLHLREKIGHTRQFFAQLLTKNTPEEEDTVFQERPAQEPAPLPASEQPLSNEGFTNREQAYTALKDIATYLETIEPHTPTPYLIRKAVEWGEINLAQLVSDMLREGNDLSLLREILNVKDEAKSG